MEKDFKDIITSKVQAACNSLINNNHSRVNLCDFSSIFRRKTENSMFFYHNIYANKYLEYFNDEENTDFLIFENNKVFIDYSEYLFTFHKVDEQEKVVEVDLDNQEIKELKDDKKEEDAENLSDEIQSKVDLVTLNYFPLSISHCNITLCYEQDLPQVLSTELLVQALQIYILTKNNSLVLGYDSLGAGCVINHLHFEFLMLDDFNDIPNLPINQRTSKLLIGTQLKHINKEEISMFDGTSLIKISVINEPFYCWKIETIVNQEDNGDITDMNNCFQNSVSHVANMILSKLIDNEIPHNLIITSQGTVFYVIPRKFEKKEHPINTCWNDLAGMITFKNKDNYDKYTEESINQFLKENISLDHKDFENITEGLLKQIESVYEIQK